MDVANVIERAIMENPEVRLVLDLAMRAREIEGRELPREIGMATEVTAIPVNSQCAV